MALTPKQDTFALEYAATGSAAEVYRRAYDVEQSSDATVQRESHKLVKHPKIALRIAELRAAAVAPALQASAIDAQWVLDRSVQLVEYGMATAPFRDRYGRLHEPVQRNPEVALKALTLISRYTGGFVEKQEISGPQRGAIPVELRAKLEAVIATADMEALIRLAGEEDARPAAPSSTDGRNQ